MAWRRNTAGMVRGWEDGGMGGDSQIDGRTQFPRALNARSEFLMNAGGNEVPLKLPCRRGSGSESCGSWVKAKARGQEVREAVSAESRDMGSLRLVAKRSY